MRPEFLNMHISLDENAMTDTAEKNKTTPLYQDSDFQHGPVVRSVNPFDIRGGLLLESEPEALHNLMWISGPPVVEHDVMPTIPQKELFKLVTKTLTSHPIILPYIYSYTIWKQDDEKSRALSTSKRNTWGMVVYLEDEPYAFFVQAEHNGLYVNLAVPKEIGCLSWDRADDGVLYIRKDGTFTTTPSECPIVHFSEENLS